MEKCEFDVNGVCYAVECHWVFRCGCKDDDGCVVRMASMEEVRMHARRVYADDLEPRITVMQPSVVNVSLPENVASEGLDTEQSVILPKM